MRWPFKLTPQQASYVVQYVEEGRGERTIAELLGLKRTIVDKIIRHFRKGLLRRGEDHMIYREKAFFFADPEKEGTTIVHKAREEINIAQLWADAEGINNRLIEYHKNLPYFDVEIRDSKPISISFLSDQHIAPNSPCDLEKMHKDAELIATIDGAYAILGGDGVDNHIKHRAATLHQRTPPGTQWQLYDYYLSLFKDSILVMVSGNHDDWTMDFAGIDMVGTLAKKNKLHYAPDAAYVNLSLNGQPYLVAMRHQYRFNSQLNLGHTVKRWYDQGEVPFDVGCVGHHHEAHFELFYRHGLDRLALRPGSYQIHSTYARRYGFNYSKPVSPTVVFWPDRREMMAFKDVHQGVEYLSFLRKQSD